MRIKPSRRENDTTRWCGKSPVPESLIGMNEKVKPQEGASYMPSLPSKYLIFNCTPFSLSIIKEVEDLKRASFLTQTITNCAGKEHKGESCLIRETASTRCLHQKGKKKNAGNKKIQIQI